MYRCATCGDRLDGRDTDHVAYLPNGRRRSYCGECRRTRQAEGRARRNRAAGAVTVNTPRTRRVAAIDWDAPRTFGVEIETVPARGSSYSAHVLVVEMRSRGLVARVGGLHDQAAALRGEWVLTGDGSIGSTGVEVVSPVLTGATGEEQVRTACAAIAAAGGTVNDHCGLHVHHQAKDLGLDQVRGVVAMYEAHNDAIASVLAPSRANGTWARYYANDREGTRDWNMLQSCRTLADMHSAFVGHDGRRPVYRHERYHTVNVCAHQTSKGTLEFRAHQGTANASKILAWVRLTAAIVRFGATGAVNGTADFDSMLALAPTETDRDYWVARRAIFARRAVRGTNAYAYS